MAGAVRDGCAEVRVIRERVADGDRDAAAREVGLESARTRQLGRQRDESQCGTGPIEDRSAFDGVVRADAVERLRAGGFRSDPRTFEMDSDRHGAGPLRFCERSREALDAQSQLERRPGDGGGEKRRHAMTRK